MIAARWKALPWILAVVLLAFSFVAANRLLHTQEGDAGAGPDAPPKKDAKPAPAPNAQGLTVLGTVDSPLGIARVDAPSLPALSGATVTAVFVQSGQLVKIGDPLMQFDDSAFRPKLEQAEGALLAARWDADKARKQKDDHPALIDLQKLAMSTAETTHKFAKEGLDRGREAFEIGLAANKMLTEADKDQSRRFKLELLEAEYKVEQAKAAWEKEKKELKRLETKPVDIDVQLATAKIQVMTGAVAEAKAAIASAKVLARTAGVVERLTAQPGMTFGPATRQPALYIVPTGARIVRAEVEAEFAHKINDRVGKTVTICDSHNFSLTYEGRVTRIGTSYLPKRGSADTLAVNPTQVLECEIEVIDPTPAGKPPLRVGQPVRVVFGQ